LRIKKNPNFFDIQKSFNDYWKAKGMDASQINTNDKDDDEGGDYGEYIQYNAGNAGFSQSFLSSGEFPDPTIAYNERNKLRSNNAARIDKINSLSANWSLLGPAIIPTKGGEGRLNCML